jgi:hypothetical protein
VEVYRPDSKSSASSSSKCANFVGTGWGLGRLGSSAYRDVDKFADAEQTELDLHFDDDSILGAVGFAASESWAPLSHHAKKFLIVTNLSRKLSITFIDQTTGILFNLQKGPV